MEISNSRTRPPSESSPAISVVMRSMNDGPLIQATLRAVYAQDFPGKIELIHIDSGSTDGTVEAIRATNPHRLIQILPQEYIPGVVLNRGMREATSDWVVFLNSDAEPANREWLAGLLTVAASAENVGAVFSRQAPRGDCQAVFAHDYDRCFGPQRESAQWEHFFSMVSCAVNRRAWEQQPFREDLQYAEDDEWSRRLKAHGWKVLFAENSVAIHSHNYTLRQAYKRAYGDNFASAATAPHKPSFAGRLYRSTLPALKDALKDWRWCRAHRRLLEWPHAFGVRIAQRLGKSDGFWKGWNHYHGQGGTTA